MVAREERKVQMAVETAVETASATRKTVRRVADASISCTKREETERSQEIHRHGLMHSIRN